MKLLFFDFTLPYLLHDSEYPVGGWAVELRSWLLGLSVCGHPAGVLTWRGGSTYAGKDNPYVLIDTYDPNKGIRIIKYIYSYMPAMLKAAQSFAPDIIIQACSGLHTGMLSFVAKKIGVPFVYRVANDMDVDHRYKARLNFYQQFAYQYGLKNTAAFSCQNRYQHDQLQKMFPKRPCHILHNPFNAAVIDHVPKGLDQKKYVAWIGVFSAQKNMQLLCNVAKAQTKMQFRIAGMPSKSIDAETKSILAELDALKNVKFIGYVKRKNILSFLSNAYCLLNTSSYEGFSNTFLEAFAAGTPVLCPSRVDPDGLVADNRLGYTAENDLELVDLLIKIRSLTADAFKRLSVRCRSYVLTAHNPETQAGKLIDYLTPLIDAKAQ